jgi:hypothetical protein
MAGLLLQISRVIVRTISSLMIMNLSVIAASFFLMNRITSNIYSDNKVRICSVTKLSQQVSVGLRPAIHLTALFCSINTLFVYFLQL